MPGGDGLENGRVLRVSQAPLYVRDDVVHGKAVGKLASFARVGDNDLFLQFVEGGMEVGLVLPRACERGKACEKARKV
jgi:hypothetical protein